MKKIFGLLLILSGCTHWNIGTKHVPAEWKAREIKQQLEQSRQQAKEKVSQCISEVDAVKELVDNVGPRDGWSMPPKVSAAIVKGNETYLTHQVTRLVPQAGKVNEVLMETITNNTTNQLMVTKLIMISKIFKIMYVRRLTIINGQHVWPAWSDPVCYERDLIRN